MTEELSKIIGIIHDEVNDGFRDFLLGCTGDKEQFGDSKFELIKSERCNSDYEVVFKVDNKYYQIIGYYDSWEGTTFEDLDDISEVRPVEETIIVYKNV